MKKIFSPICFLLLAAVLLQAGGQDKPVALKKFKPEELDPRYRRWLQEEVVYIIHPKETEVFLQLQSDRERELFIEAFWKQRDPNPSTLQNEFKTEHFKRISDANQRFGRGAPGPGWRTDRGRIYIILGEPKQVRTYDNLSEIVPVEIWFYQGYSEYGLPNGFYVVFFKRDMSGDYEIYSPFRDGPNKLLQFSEMYQSYDPSEWLSAYNILRRAEPEVARSSLSLIAGEEHIIQSPSLSSDALLTRIAQYPYKKVKQEYAENFLRYRDIVEVDYSANYISSSARLAVSLDERGAGFVHYALEPGRLSVESYEGRVFALLELNGRISDPADKTVFQFDRTIQLNLTGEDVAALRSRPFSLQGLFPLAEGRYKAIFILKNKVSKEFTTVESEVIIPAPPTTLSMTPLVIGYGTKPLGQEGEIKAFSYDGRQVFVSADLVFSVLENLQVVAHLLGPAEELRRVAAVEFVILNDRGETVRSRARKFSGDLERRTLFEDIPLEGISPAEYRLEVRVADETGRVIVFDAAAFQVSPVPRIPRPLVHSEFSPPPGNAVYSYILGSQHFNMGHMEKAEACLAEAHHLEPQTRKYALGYSAALLARSKYRELIQLLEPLLADEKPEAEVYEHLGLARMALGEFQPAIDRFVEYLTRYGAKISVFNALGECYSKVGDKENALFAWEKSLELNPGQDEIVKAVAALKEKR